MCRIFDIVKERLTALPNLDADDEISLSTLHQKLFNEEPAIFSVESAKTAIDELDVFECMGVVQVYHQQNFNCVQISLADACEVANEVISIIGFHVFCKIFDDENNETWDDILTADDLIRLGRKARKWLEENPEGINDVWLEMPTRHN